MKPFLTFTLLAGMAFAMPVAAQTLQVGAYPSNPPWEFKNEQSEFVGFEVDLVREIAERMERDVNIQDLGVQALFAATSSGRIDMAISTISITPERLENQSFTQPYYESALAMVTAQDNVSSLEDLEGRPVGAVASTTGEAWIAENTEVYGFGEYRSYTTLQNLLLDVANGRLAGAFSEVLGMRFAIEQMPQITIAETIPNGERFAIMMPRGSDLLEEVNQTITEIKEDGTMAEFYAEWLGAEPETGSATATAMPVPTE